MSSDILNSIHGSVKNLHEAGIADSVTMREFDELCLEPAKALSKSAIKKLRLREKVSQPVFAMYLNVSPSAVKKWETGEKNPSGAALRLLRVVEKYGVAALI